jgi:type IV pilus assembly protein PilC
MESFEYQIYKWQGVNKHGEVIKGRMGALSPEQVTAQLAHQNIDVQEIGMQSQWLTRINQTSPKTRDIVLFSRQLSTMINAGVPLTRALEIINTGITNLYFQAIIMNVHLNVSSGETFTASLAQFPKIFDTLFCNLVKSGELSGNLGIILEQLAEYLESVEVLKGRVKKALFYPIVVLTIAIAISVLLLIFIVPQFEDLFNNFGKELPAPTRVVLAASAALAEYWLIAIGIIVVLIIAYMYFKKHSYKFQYFMDKVKLSMPIFGSLFSKAILARVMRTLGITLGSGIPLVQGIESMAKITGNHVYTESLLKVKDELISGEHLSYALSGDKAFPNMVVQMIAVGEESGEMEAMMYKISEYYDEQVKVMVDGLSTLIEPIMLVVLGVVIGGFVISMYLPIFELGNAV